MAKNITSVLQRLKKYQPKVVSDSHLFETKYGYFTNHGREYVVKTPHTPGLWANFLTNGKYTALVTPTGGGYSWAEESGYNRVLREHPLRHLVEDTPGRYLYIKDLKTNDYWSSTYQPVKKCDHFEAVHSLGFTKSKTSYKGIKSETTFFVPLNQDFEIWWTKIKNNSKKKRTLKIYTYCEFVLGAYKPDIIENAFHGLFASGSRFNHALIFNKPILETKDNLIVSTFDKIGFFAASEDFTEYEISRRDFIGFGRSLSDPKALCNNNQLSSCPRSGENSIGCVAIEIELNPGQEKQLYFALGVTENSASIHKICRDLRKKNYVHDEFKKVIDYWDEYIAKVWIKTPDEGLNIFCNYWLKYQVHFNAHWSEMDSFYIGGGGGFGYRDTAQHIWGILPFERELYLKQLRYLLSHQYPDGSVPHGISVYTDKAAISPHVDDACWLVFAVLNYLEETGDMDFLEEKIPFIKLHPTAKPASGAVFKHLIRATDFTLRHLSERGIPQLMIADWNDALSGGSLGKGESFLVAGLLAHNLKRIVSLCKKLERTDKIQEYEFAYKRLEESVAMFGWDGEWFLRATEDHQKLPIGSKKNPRGKLFLDSNTWLCISGLASSYTNKTLDSIWDFLVTKYGALLFNPAYNTADVNRGVVSQFVPGSKENAGIFLHANAWLMIALAQNGEAGKAYELLRRVNPIYQSLNDADRYKVEPYVLPEFIFGNESDKFGEGSFTWVTGSSEWFFRGIVDYFLGLRPFYDQLIFEPKVPKDWRFVIEREFQGRRWRAEYNQGKTSLKQIK